MCWLRCSRRARAPPPIIEERGLVQVSDTGEIEAIIDEVIAANPKQVEQYRAGKEDAVRLLRRPGDEGFKRKSESEDRQRALANTK